MNSSIKALFGATLSSCLLVGSISPAQSQASRAQDVISNQLEGVYTRGLRSLVNSQKPDGSWGDSQGNAPGVVGLAVLSMLAHGDDPNVGPYAKNIKRALDYIIKKQNSNGYIGDSMYNHGFATLALAEAYGAVRDERLGPALQKAVELIVSSQKRNTRGGWRYTPDSRDADSTVSGCQLVALYAARNAGIAVPDESLKRALTYINSCRGGDGSYGYVSPSGGRVTLTAIGVLSNCLAKNKEDAAYKKSVAYLQKNLNYRDDTYPFYFEYYMSQALFQADEKVWREWNDKNLRLLASSQLSDGGWDSSYGKSYTTAAALLSLALNYRFLPIYEK